MKKILYIIPFLLCFGNTFAQNTPEFSFKLYFEDAVGNKDTVTLGYDPMATDSIDTIFGEANIINQAWDTDFEVRIGNKTYNTFQEPNTINSFLTKKQIVESNCNSFVWGDVFIQIKTNHYPVTISWDSSSYINTFFANRPCNDLMSGFVGTGWKLNLQAPYPYASNQNQFFPLGYAENTSIQFTNSKAKLKTPTHSPATYTNEWIPLNYYEKNNTKIINLRFVFRRSLSAAGVNTYLMRGKNIKIYPNPICSNNYLNVSRGGRYLIFNEVGKIVQAGKITNQKVKIKNLNKGIYFLVIKNKKYTYRTKVIVK